MGIRGLLKYIRSDQSTIKLESTVLFKRCGEKLILICDLVAVFYWLIALLHKAKVASKDYSKYTCIYGGNFKDYKERILEFVKALRFINVEPVFFWDGPQGSSFDYEHKLDTWKYRSKKLLRKIRENSEICKFHAIEIKFEKRLKQTLLFEELVYALRDAGVTVNLCEGEADNIMAQYAREHKEVCTILTNDTDMALMSGVSMVHYKFFDRKDALELSRPVLKCRSHEICCDIIKPQHLARDLKIDEKCLPALSILCGNDYTKPLNETININESLGFSHPFVASVSVWVKHHENDCKSADLFLNIKQIQEICKDHPEYCDAIKYSYSFYQAKCVSASGVPASPIPIHDLVVEKVKKYQLDRQFLPLVRNGIMWRYEIEHLNERFPCIHEKLQPVRELLYKLLCISRVTEYGQYGMVKFGQFIINVYPCEPETLQALIKLPFSLKIQLMFNALLTCTEEIEWMDDDDIRESIFLLGNLKQTLHIAAVDEPDKIKEYIGAALTCTCILFVIKNKLIPKMYIDALIMACFSCAMDETPPKLAARPGPTGVTIGAQFMVILRHARLLASLLGLEELLPLPSSIFQPFIYIPLHGTAFKNFRKEHFYNDDEAVKKYYLDLADNKSFIQYRNCITTATTPTDCFADVVDQYLSTKVLLLDRKISATTHDKKLKKKK